MRAPDPDSPSLMMPRRAAALVAFLLAVVAVLPPGPALVGAEGEPASTAAPEPTATPVAVVAVPEIAARIEETAAVLRKLERILATPPQIAAIEEKLPDLARSIEERKEDPARLLAQGAPARVIEYLNATWQGIRDDLTGWSRDLTRRSVELEGALQDLGAQRDLWAASRTEAAASQAPPELLKRIDATIDSIKQLQDKFGERRKQTLILQSRVASEVAPSEKILADLGEARLARVGKTLERDSPPLWEIGRGAGPNAGARAALSDVRDLLAYKSTEAREWLSANRGQALGQLLLLFCLGLFLRLAGRRAGTLDGSAELADGVTRVLSRPWSAAIVLVIVASRRLDLHGLYGQLPDLLDQATTFLLLPAAYRLLRGLAPRTLGPYIWIFTVFVVLDQMRAMLLAVPDVERLWLIGELLAAIGCLAAIAFGRSARLGDLRAALGLPRMRELALLGIALCATALGAAIGGWMELARLLSSAVLASIAIGVIFRIVARIAEAVVAVLLRVPPLGTANSVVHHRIPLEGRIRGAIDLFAVAAWVFAVLRNLAVGHLVLEAGKGLLETRIGAGGMSLSLGDALAFGLTLWVAALLSRFVRFLLDEEIYPRVELPRGIPFAISTVLHYALIGTGFVLALGGRGLDLNRVTVLAGAFGVGIGFGLQNIVNNFVSGLILLFERPIQVGDEVQVGDLVGEVRNIGVRSSTVRTPRGADVIVPNGSLISERVTNWTRPDRLRRIDVVVSTRYDADPEKVLRLLRETARTHPAILADPPPEGLLTRFAENSMWFELRAWTNRLEQVAAISSDLHVRSYRTLGEAGYLPE